LIKPDLRADFHIGRILGVRDQQGTICAIALDGIGSLIGQAATTRLEVARNCAATSHLRPRGAENRPTPGPQEPRFQTIEKALKFPD
jgi:hypothetical protein